MAQALERTPTLVMFSGGRDSSGLLALATRVARQNGLDPPVPFTHVHQNDAEADETSWQKRLIVKLGLEQWERVTIRDEFDFVGRLSTGLLKETGVLWPPNLHSHRLGARAAAGGSLITGVFGDEVMSQVPRMVRIREALGKGRLGYRDLMTLGLRFLPSYLRTRVWLMARRPATPRWLTEEAADEVARLVAADEAANPIGWPAEVDHWWRGRQTQLIRQSLHTLGSVERTTVAAPFGDPRFLAALKDRWGFAGVSSRSAAMNHLFADVLEQKVIGRRTKASFNQAFWGPQTRAFAIEWDGRTALETLINAADLRSVWGWTPGESLDPHQFQAALSLQHIWLETTRDTGDISS